MKYAVEFKSQHTGIYGLLIYETNKEATNAYYELYDVWVNEYLSGEEFVYACQGIFQTAEQVFQEVDHEKLEHVIENVTFNFNNETFTDSLTIVNYGDPVKV